MATHDFEVDLDSLINAAVGAQETIKALKDGDVVDYTPTKGSLGSEIVWAAVDEFNDRWEISLNYMVDDIGEVAGRLAQVAQAYADFDAETHQTFVTRLEGFTALDFPGTGHA